MDETFENQAGEPSMTGGPIEQVEGAVKRVVLAGVGAAATVADTAESTFDRFVERGAEVEREMKQRAEEMRQQNMGTRSRVLGYVRTVMDQVLGDLNIPSKSDVDAINVKLNILNRKLDDLQLEQMQRSAPPPEPPSVDEIAT